MTIRRRKVIAGSAAVAVGLGVVVGVGGPALATGGEHGGGKARNIILLIGDGMGTTHVNVGRQVRYGVAGELVMETLPTHGTVSTWAVQRDSDAPEPVTDSASAATAWASGVKTYNAAIGLDAYGEIVPTMMEQASEAGLRTGNVSTAEITDATPAAQMSHATLRGCQGPEYTAASCETLDGAAYLPIAQQIARNQVADVILGGGNQRFTAEDQQIMEGNGYTTLGAFGEKPATRGDLEGVEGRDQRVIGLFNEANMTVEVNKAKAFPDASVTEEPSLAEMTDKALELLTDSEEGEKEGFFLQVEGAQIDKRSHANDAAQTIGEILAFDDAVAEAKAFAEEDGNTLVIVTADHECAGFNIVAKDSITNAEATTPPVNQAGTSSTETPVRAETQEADPARSTGPVNGAGSGNGANFAPATFRTADDPAGVEDGSLEASLWLSYLSGNHTGQDVPLYAYGPGSDSFEDRNDNTDLFDEMTTALRGLSG